MFAKIKDDILGKDYELSLPLVSEKKSRELNKKWRHKDRATNVLSFSLTKNSGELILCPTVIKKELRDENRNFGKTNFDDLLGFLVIHGMLHLKGHEHSSKMDRLEKKYDQKYFSGNRRGLHHDAGRSGRIRARRKKS